MDFVQCHLPEFRFLLYVWCVGLTKSLRAIWCGTRYMSSRFSMRSPARLSSRSSCSLMLALRIGAHEFGLTTHVFQRTPWCNWCSKLGVELSEKKPFETKKWLTYRPAWLLPKMLDLGVIRKAYNTKPIHENEWCPMMPSFQALQDFYITPKADSHHSTSHISFPS